MPGVVAFGRRWALGSDDLVVPMSIFFLLHLASLSIMMGSWIIDNMELCTESSMLSSWTPSTFSLVLISELLCDLAMVLVSFRGTVFDEDLKRRPQLFLLYLSLGLRTIEVIMAVTILFSLLQATSTVSHNCTSLLVVCFMSLGSSTLLLLLSWCVFDAAGRSWVRLKRYQKKNLTQLGERASVRSQLKRSGANPFRSWRHRKVRMAYQSSWLTRCHLLFCCVNLPKARTKDSFSDIARILSDFFLDLDLVPTDVISGLVLLRRRQQTHRLRLIRRPSNPVYECLSGVTVTPSTRFLSPREESTLLVEAHRLMHFALAIYGWPMFLKHVGAAAAAVDLVRNLNNDAVTVEDDCCTCHLASQQALLQDLGPDVRLVHVALHVDVGQLPFMVALDSNRIIVAIRGTLSPKDVITDLKAESDLIPVRPQNEMLLAHKGMVEAAKYVWSRLLQDDILFRASSELKSRNSSLNANKANFDLVVVGHSLGAGAASILAMMLRTRHDDFARDNQLREASKKCVCYAFSPPGGCLSDSAAELSREFVTSLVVGKDIVPRLGLHQLEAFRRDLVQTLHDSQKPKWLTLMGSMNCCYHKSWPCLVSNRDDESMDLQENEVASAHNTALNALPWDQTVSLSVHQPLFPPGQIIHLVRHYRDISEGKRKCEPQYKAIWSEQTHFDEILISKHMVQDHMPYNVLSTLHKMIHGKDGQNEDFDTCQYEDRGNEGASYTRDTNNSTEKKDEEQRGVWSISATLDSCKQMNVDNNECGVSDESEDDLEEGQYRDKRTGLLVSRC